MSKLMFSIVAIALGTILVAPPAALAGPAANGCETQYDLNGDGKDDAAAFNPTNGLVRSLTIDGVAFLNTGFPTVLGVDWAAIGGGNFTGDVSGKSGLAFQKIAGTNAGLTRVVNLDANGIVATTNFFPFIAPAGMRIVAIGDLDDDGVYDFVGVQETGGNTGLIRVWLMNANGTVKQTGFPGFLIAGFQMVGAGDVNGDGRFDLVSVKTVAPNLGLVNVRHVAVGGVTFSASAFPFFVASESQLVGLGCVDADSNWDYFVEKISGVNTGLVNVKLSNVDGTGVAGNTFPLVQLTANTIAGIGNYDGMDGVGVLSRKGADPNSGLLRVQNLTADGNGVSSQGFPGFQALNFEMVTNYWRAP